eukprot:804866-Alexandrium_andersonii.AAC.1
MATPPRRGRAELPGGAWDPHALAAPARRSVSRQSSRPRGEEMLPPEYEAAVLAGVVPPQGGGVPPRAASPRALSPAPRAATVIEVVDDESPPPWPGPSQEPLTGRAA